jgi:para-aminobenzoate synthetase/4-amino-4-deoxychorismate lyase
MPELAVLYDPQAGNWLRFSDPLEEIEIHAVDKVLSALEYIEERVEKEGLFAAGFVSYEAASAFDDALQTHASGDFPLLRFGLFAVAERIDLPTPAEEADIPDWRPQETAARYATKIDEIHAAIARGETYQVNLTFPLTSNFSQAPWLFFLHLVHGQQAGGAGYLQTDRWAICSVSPELFFTRNGDRLTMRPMKGTAPRGRTPEEDRRQAENLQKSVKNRAENIMILDMVRNDLGRLAPPGEVHTKEICTLEKYPTVWQLTSTVTARSNESLAATFQALFPCASITGAPKIRTMQIINATEAGPRQIYTGTFGWVAPGKQAHFNVAIRTALIDRQNKRAIYGVGAGITWDSDSAEEYQECLDKAAVLSQPIGDFALIETLRWTPGKGYFILQEHLNRLQSSADYFSIECSTEEVLNYLLALAEDFSTTPQRVRLLLHNDGRLEGTFIEIETPSSTPLKIRLASQPIDSQNALLYHKTTQRQLYETCLAEAEDVDEVVLWNERGEVTEFCTANLVVEISGRLLTPPVSCGLLPGTYREFLLQRGILTEQVLTVDDLRKSSRIYLINAVRKWRRAQFCSEQQ